MSLRIIYKAQRGTKLRQGRGYKVGVPPPTPTPGVLAPSCVTYLLYHDAVDAHVFFTPGVVEDVDPAQSQTQHQEGQVFIQAAEIQPSCGQEEDGLEQTGVSSREQ